MSGLKILRSLLFPQLATAKNCRSALRCAFSLSILWRGIKGEAVFAFLFLLFSSSPASAQFTLLYQKGGAATFVNLGYAVAGAGDVNGDGRGDFIIGAINASPGGLSGAGSAYVYSGATGTLLYQKDGAAANDNLGSSVASAGDVNGDGKADFIIGAIGADAGGVDAGSAYVYSGATGALLYQKNGAAAGDFLGWSAAGAGDVNGDGRADFIVGAFLADPGGPVDAGSAYVYSGATGALLYQKNGGAGDSLGISVASAGDVNGDGRADFIVGAFVADPGGQLGAGSAYVYSGATGALLYQKNGGAAGDHLGRSVASAGDVNGDGKTDFIVGATRAQPGGLVNAGSVYVYSGATGALLFQKNGAVGEFLGISVAGAGDVNGDGRADFIIGTNSASPGGLGEAGSAFLYSGADGSLLFQKNGAAAFDWLGYSVAGAGDVNGDGRADIIVGAFKANPGGNNDAGSAFVYGLPAPPDPPVSPTPLYKKNGADSLDFLGHTVAIVGDINGDGKADYIIGAYGANPGGLNFAGSAYVYSGTDGTLLYQKNGGTAGDQFGFSVAGAGDVNGDGKADFIAATPTRAGGAGSAYVYSGVTGALLYQKNGTAGDALGQSVAGAGDVNFDGKADFIVGAMFASPGGLSGAGSAYVYSGATGGLLYQKNGAAAGDNLGVFVAGAGDVDNNGLADFIIGALNTDPGGRTDAGSAYVYSGNTGALLYQKDGTLAKDHIGASVAGIGNVNGDGSSDFIIGAYGTDPAGDSAAGSAYVYSGATGALLYQKNGAADSNFFGFSVAGAGDVNNDGRADFIVGAYGASPGGNLYAGSVYVYSGATGVLLSQQNGAMAGDNLGISVGGGGDINGDGKSDFIAGADVAHPNGPASGTAIVFAVNRKPLLTLTAKQVMEGQLLSFAPTATDSDGAIPTYAAQLLPVGASFIGNTFNWTPASYQTGIHHVRFIASDGFLTDTQLVQISVLADTLKSRKNGSSGGDLLGSSVSGGGDVNGDGVADYIIGAPGADPVVGGEGNVSTDAGSIFIYSGKNDTLIYKINGTTSGDRLGGSVGLVGDANADGKGDFIIGAPEANATAGAVYVYSGSTGLLLFQKNGSTSGDRLGGSVGLYADVNADGKDDFIVGTPGADPSGMTDAGSAFIYSGANGTLLYQKDGASPGDRLGGSVGMSADVNDVNGDSRGDFIIGADGTNSSSGAVYVYSGSTGSLLYQKNGTAIGDRLGGSVGLTQVLDVDSDNRADFVVGATGVSGSSGAVYVYSGSTGNLLFQKTGSLSGDRLGGSVGIQADVDGDGGADFIAGAPGTDDSAGAAFIYSGSSGALIFQQNGDSTGDRLGGSVGIYADVSGLAHYIIGAPNADPNNNPDAGSAFIFQLQEKGDLNGDGILTAADVVHMLNCTFLGSSLGIDCANLSVADINCDGILTAADVVKELNGVFLGFSLDCSF